MAPPAAGLLVPSLLPVLTFLFTNVTKLLSLLEERRPVLAVDGIREDPVRRHLKPLKTKLLTELIARAKVHALVETASGPRSGKHLTFYQES